jgi:Beta-xylosidase
MRNPVKKFKRNAAAIRFFPVGMPTLRGWCWTGSSGFILHIPLLMMNRLLWMPILRPTWCIGPSIHACFQRKTSHGCAVLCGHRLSSRPMTVIIFSSEGTTYRTTLRLAVSVWLWQTIRQVLSKMCWASPWLIRLWMAHNPSTSLCSAMTMALTICTMADGGIATSWNCLPIYLVSFLLMMAQSIKKWLLRTM